MLNLRSLLVPSLLVLLLPAACAHKQATGGTMENGGPTSMVVGPNIVKVVWSGADATLGPGPTSVGLNGPVSKELIDQPQPSGTTASPDSSRRVADGMMIGSADATKLPAGDYTVESKDLACTPAKITLPAPGDVTITCKKLP